MRHRVISTALMSFFLSFLMSCWVTLINLGWSDAFLGQWMSAFRLAWPAAAAIAFCFGPFVQNATTYITQRIPR